jgi:Fe-S-cluster-containing dehydrogenase component/DMSO reductase anchor subunit
MSSLEHRASLVDELLAEQAKPGTAVTKFSDWHEAHDAEPAQARYYRDLIPLSKPVRGEQYAFEVNLDQCTGCKACVVACHSMNGLDDDESWRDVGMLVGDVYIPYQQTITTACHHCADPACANGCPVLAYDKDKDTGIVRHLDDQCIGCSYCQMKCPYDVPKFNKKRGIVRKCDMCQQRLAVGEAPACVQSCPNGAIAIRIVKTAEVLAEASFEMKRLLPGTMDSGYTKPSTRYLSSKPVPETASHSDSERPRVEEAHTPLAIMLVLTQFATGALLFAHVPAQKWIGFIAAVIGINASVLHLGQPLKAWRCFLGWRKSWLSREILAFGAFAPAAFAAAMDLMPASWAAAVGVASVLCSVMVYVDTRRPFWVMTQTLPKFFGTTLVLGLALGSCFDSGFAPIGAVIAAMKLAWEAMLLSSPDEALDRTKRLLLGPLRMTHLLRFIIGLTGVGCLLQAPMLGLGLLLVGEFLERSLFFKAGAAWKMPGNA